MKESKSREIERKLEKVKVRGSKSLLMYEVNPIIKLKSKDK